MAEMIEQKYGPFRNLEFSTEANRVVYRLTSTAKRMFGAHGADHIEVVGRENIVVHDHEYGPQSEAGYFVVRISTTLDARMAAESTEGWRAGDDYIPEHLY